MKVFLVQESTGSYDTYNSRILAVFANESDAKRFVEKYPRDYKRLLYAQGYENWLKQFFYRKKHPELASRYPLMAPLQHIRHSYDYDDMDVSYYEMEVQ